MIRLNNASALPKGWLAFELNVLKRLKFASISLPFASDSGLGVYLKRWKIKIAANDILQSSWAKAVAKIQNNSEQLTEEQIGIALADAYVPRYKLYNQSLRNWFNETDSWWFDNVRENIESIDSPFARAIALELGMNVGDYVLSFNEQTLELRQPLSQVFRRLWKTLPAPVNNGKNNVCTNKEARDFLAESYTDVMFLRLPRAHNASVRNSLSWTAWREDWVRGNDSFWSELETLQTGRLGTHVETKHQYLRLVEDMLQTASHLPTWVIVHVEDGFISTPELVQTINNVRRVETIYTKDFSELTGAKVVILTA